MSEAASALSGFIGKEVRSDATLLRSGSDGAPFPGGEFLGLQLRISGNVGGSILILFPEHDARVILALLLGGEAAGDLPLTALEASALKEVGNIMASACLNALGRRLKMALLPSIPQLVSGTAAGLVAEALSAAGAEATAVVETRFSIAEPPCGGSFLLIPAPGLLEAAPNDQK